MLFAFRGIRAFQLFTALLALAAGVGGAVAAKAFADGGSGWLLFAAGFLGLVFFWLFTTTLRAPTSFVAISPERTRIRFAGFVDTVVDNRDVLGATVENRNIFGGVGVRTNFSGRVALASTWGPVAEIHLRRPIRVWLIPRLIPLQATRLQVSVRHPAKLVERFGPPRGPVAQPAVAGPRKVGRGTRSR